MDERYDIVKGLNDLREALGFGLPDRSPVIQKYLDNLTRAINLLADNEPLKIKTFMFDRFYGEAAQCPSCGFSWIMRRDDKTHYCPGCGTAVEWEQTDKPCIVQHNDREWPKTGDVITGLTCLNNGDVLCKDCPYADADGFGHSRCKTEITTDAIFLLKKLDAEMASLEDALEIVSQMAHLEKVDLIQILNELFHVKTVV